MNLITNAIKFSHSGGNIHVSSQLGLGTTFTIMLPIAKKVAITS